MSRIAISEATSLLDQLIAHWRERMGDDFAVGGQKLSDVTTLRDEVQTAIQESDAAIQVANDNKASRDGLLKDAEKLRSNYRRQVAIAKGTHSSEYQTIPEPAPNTHKKITPVTT